MQSFFVLLCLILLIRIAKIGKTNCKQLYHFPKSRSQSQAEGTPQSVFPSPSSLQFEFSQQFTFIIWITITRPAMILNEQLIQDMFQDEPSRDLPSVPREDISLNFTASSRSSKNNKKSSPSALCAAGQAEAGEIAAMAQAELAKFDLWLQAQGKQAVHLQQLNALIEKIEIAAGDMVDQEDLLIIKGELFKHEEQAVAHCTQCPLRSKRMQEMEQQTQKQAEQLNLRNKQVEELKQAMLDEAIEEVKEYLLAGVENSALRREIKELHGQISALKNEKALLQRTFLFNKTRNSQINILQKSKDLSAAKNSTNSSEILTRNHETIVFIDPIESDVEEWIRFFEAQKNRYRLLCKKQTDERQRELGRPFTRQQKEAFEGEDKLSILFNSIKEILRQLLRIRENTTAFEQTELSKSGLREKLRGEQEAPLRQELQKMHCKLGKTLKINEYLLREKLNLEEINCCLKQQRLHENNERKNLAQMLKRQSQRVSELIAKVRELEEAVRQANHALIEKEEELLYSFEEIKKLKKAEGGKNCLELENKCRQLEKKYQEKLKEHEFDKNSYIFKLKKEALERRKYYNEIEEMKGSFRIYCRISANQPQSVISQSSASLFHKVVTAQPTQDKIFDDVKRLLMGAFDGFSFTVFNYHQTDSKNAFLHGDEYAPSTVVRIMREMFRVIDAEKDFKVEVTLSVCEIGGERLTDLMDGGRLRTGEFKQDSISLGQLQQVAVECLEAAEEVLSFSLSKAKEKAQIVVRIGLEIHNVKTYEKYRARATLVNLIDCDHHSAKGLSALSKCLYSFNQKEKIVPCRDNKLTQALKECFSANSKIVMVVNLGETAGREEVRQALSFAESCRYGERRRGQEEEGRGRRSISRKNL